MDIKSQTYGRLVIVYSYLLAFLFISFAFLVVSILSPIPVAIRIVGEERIIRLASCIHIVL